MSQDRRSGRYTSSGFFVFKDLKKRRFYSFTLEKIPVYLYLMKSDCKNH